MNWFLIICIFIGAFIGLIPGIITNAIRKGVESEYWERDKQFGRARGWLLVFGWVIICLSVAFTLQTCYIQDKEIKELTRRIELLEPTPQIDTIVVNEVGPQNDTITLTLDEVMNYGNGQD